MKKFLLFLLLSFNFKIAFTLENFIFAGGNSVSEYLKELKSDKYDGIQIIYNWKQLESAKDIYNFDIIEKDLQIIESLNKKLWIQIQDRFFESNHKFVPNYILEDKEYEGGLVAQIDNPGENKLKVQGWVSKQWNKNLRIRYQKLLANLAKKFDGKIYGINLPETSINIHMKQERKKGFNCNIYFNSIMENINFVRKVFKKSYVVQYVNFFPCEWNNDRKYMSRFFENALQHNIGLGGPDIVPYRKGQMKNSYPFFNRYKDKLNIIAFAVQEPTRTYINPNTQKKFTDLEFQDFAENYLGAKIIFWSIN